MKTKIGLTENQKDEFLASLTIDELFDCLRGLPRYANKDVFDYFLSESVYKPYFGELLTSFFNHKSDANKYLEASEQEDLENDFGEWIDSIN